MEIRTPFANKGMKYFAINGMILYFLCKINHGSLKHDNYK